MDFSEKAFIIWDLDGTLTDPADGITRSVQAALRHFGLSASREELLDFIGPPLADSFAGKFGFSPKQCEEAIRYYREYFSKTGIFENRVYPGIPELLRQIQAAGKQNFLASSKPEVFCRKILDHFSILEPFSQVAGSNLEGKRAEKHAVLQYLLEQSGIDPAKAVMIGDRKFDVLGAAEFSIPCIGGLWGHGSREELEKAGAAAAVSAPEELSRLLLGK